MGDEDELPVEKAQEIMNTPNLREEAMLPTNSKLLIEFTFIKSLYFIYNKAKSPKTQSSNVAWTLVIGDGVCVANLTFFPTVKIEALGTGLEAVRHQDNQPTPFRGSTRTMQQSHYNLASP